MTDVVNNGEEVVIYCRSASLAANDSPIEEQEIACRKFADEKGYEVKQVFHDLGKSGVQEDRSGLQAMLSYVAELNRPISVLVKDNSRIARSNQLFIRVTEKLNSVGSKLVAIG